MLVLNYATLPNLSVPIVFVWILKGLLYIISYNLHLGFPGGSDGKESSCNAEDMGSIPGLGRPPGGGHGNMTTHSSIPASRIPVDSGTWKVTVYGVAKSWT